jgi:hypothetical protein
VSKKKTVSDDESGKFPPLKKNRKGGKKQKKHKK